jgi:hypothetical protein
MTTFTEILTESLTEFQWQTVQALAQALAEEQLRLDNKSDGICTELKKTVAYLYINVNQPDAKSQFFKYLKTLASNGKQIGHSGKTPDYYRYIEKICRQYLEDSENDAESILHILGWVVRLVRYYKEGGLVETATSSTMQFVASTRQVEITIATKSYEFQRDQILDARVTKITGNKVTYEILKTTQKLTEKEPKKAGSLQEGQTVKVKITALKEDRGIKNVKFYE